MAWHTAPPPHLGHAPTWQAMRIGGEVALALPDADCETVWLEMSADEPSSDPCMPPNWLPSFCTPEALRKDIAYHGCPSIDD